MPLFEYKGIDSKQKSISGVIDAESERAARAKLRKQKIYPSKLVPEGSGNRLKNLRLKKKKINIL